MFEEKCTLDQSISEYPLTEIKKLGYLFPAVQRKVEEKLDFG